MNEFEVIEAKLAAERLGGEPSTGTKADRRLKGNKGKTPKAKGSSPGDGGKG